jgi:gamma-glutamylcyclotransferase (GGCT)/AIG2-like uncharacterized protein YtfP
MLLFIYGTLKTGGGNHYVLSIPNRMTGESAKLLGEYWIDGAEMYSLGGAPALKLLKDDDFEPYTRKVYGELWDVPNLTVFTRLDSLEGHPNLYCRRAIAWCQDRKADIEAYVFQYDVSHCERIPSGKWSTTPTTVDVVSGDHGVETH